MTRFETTQARRTAERAPSPAYWLISKNENRRIEVLTLHRDGEALLPVFSYEEEAALFLQLGGVSDGWRVRESRAGELVSVLYEPCAGVKEVVLDPLPEMVAERTVDLVSLHRERFIERITTRGRSPGTGDRIGVRRCAAGTGGAR